MSSSLSAPASPFFLFGSTRSWTPPPWTTSDDRVRGGASQSYLTALPDNGARFYGTLDFERLGGAGFASQFSPVRRSTSDEEEAGTGIAKWDLSAFDGVELEYVTAASVAAGKGEGGGKVFTLILKDRGEDEGQREDGRAKAGVNWEYDFRDGEGVVGEAVEGKEGGEQRKVWIPWLAFRATYRGKDVDDAGELRKDAVWRVGIMMRSMFGQQKGDFSIELRSLSARKKEEKVVTKSEL